MVFIGDTDAKHTHHQIGAPPNTENLKRVKSKKGYSRHIWTKRRAEIKILFRIEYKVDALTLIKNIYERV